MLEQKDAAGIAAELAKNLAGVSRNEKNFERLPDKYWGYFARGHDAKGRFAVIVAYSESESDVDDLIGMYEDWVAKSRN